MFVYHIDGFQQHLEFPPFYALVLSQSVEERLAVRTPSECFNMFVTANIVERADFVGLAAVDSKSRQSTL